MRKFIIGWALLIGIIGIHSCQDDTEVCDVDTRTQLRADFKVSNTNGGARDTVLPAVSFYALEHAGDSLFRKQALRGMQFELNRLADSALFHFNSEATGNGDTIKIYYSRKPIFISAGCGFVTEFKLDTIIHTQHHIQQIIITNSEVKTINETNLHIYF